jgi:hypothetical protein
VKIKHSLRLAPGFAAVTARGGVAGAVHTLKRLADGEGGKDLAVRLLAKPREERLTAAQLRQRIFIDRIGSDDLLFPAPFGDENLCNTIIARFPLARHTKKRHFEKQMAFFASKSTKQAISHRMGGDIACFSISIPAGVIPKSPVSVAQLQRPQDLSRLIDVV